MSETGASVRGVFFDGTTSEAREAQLQLLEDGGVVLLEVGQQDMSVREKTPVSYRGDELRISSRLGNTPRYIYFPGGGKFETPDNAELDRWQKRAGGSRWVGLAHYLENHGGVVLLSVVAALLILWLSGRYLLPVSGEFIVEHLPPSVSQQLGKRSLALMDAHLFTPSTLGEPRKRQLQSLFAGAFADQVGALGLSLHFRAGGEAGANAFALPSGDLVLTDELVNLAGNDRELLAVMAHEVGHVYHHHMLRQLVQNSLLVFVFTMITGDTSTVSSLLVTAPMLALEMAYSRRFEREADTYALDFMRGRHIPLVNFSNIMQRLEWWQQYRCDTRRGVTPAQSGDGSGRSKDVLGDALRDYLSTHPATAERMADFGRPTVQKPSPPDCSHGKGGAGSH